jgi:hypothetical protein
LSRLLSLHDSSKLYGKVDFFKFDASQIATFDDYLLIEAHLGSKEGRKTLLRQGILRAYSYGTHAPIILGKSLTFIPRILWPKENLIVDVGRQKVIDYLVNSAPAGFTHCGIGTDSTSPVGGNNALGAQVDRRSIDNKRRVGTDARMTTFFPSTSPAVGNTIREMGIFDAASGGNMYARSISFTAFSFGTGESLTVDYTSGW